MEAQALSRAVRWHSQTRVLLNGHRTVVFRLEPRVAVTGTRPAIRNTLGLGFAHGERRRTRRIERGRDHQRRTGRRPVQSVDRALTILELLARDGEAGVTEIAAGLGVHKSTAFRLLVTLEAHRLVEQVNDRGRYRLGVGNLRLAGATTARLDLVTEARPVCRQLAADTGETVNITVRSETSALYLDQVAGVLGSAVAQLGRAAHPAARHQQRQGAAERALRGGAEGGAA